MKLQAVDSSINLFSDCLANELVGSTTIQVFTECPAEGLGETADSPLPQELTGVEVLAHICRGGATLTVGSF